MAMQVWECSGMSSETNALMESKQSLALGARVRMSAQGRAPSRIRRTDDHGQGLATWP